MTRKTALLFTVAAAAIVAGCQTRSTQSESAAGGTPAAPQVDWNETRVALAGETYDLYWDSNFNEATCEVRYVRTFEEHLQEMHIEGPSHGTLVDMGVQPRTHSEGCAVDARVIGYRPDPGYTGSDRVSVYWGGQDDDNPMVEDIRVFADYVAVGQAMFAYSHPTERPIAGTPPPAAAFTPPPAGFTFTVAENAGPETWTITESGPSWSMTSSTGRSITSTGPFLIATRYATPEFSLEQTYDADASFLFPLSVGERAVAPNRGSDSNGNQWEGHSVCTVLAAVTVDIPAGSFDTYKVQCLRGGNWLPGGNSSAPWGGETFYYAPSVGAVVVSRFQDRGGQDETGAWTSFSPGANS